MREIFSANTALTLTNIPKSNQEQQDILGPLTEIGPLTGPKPQTRDDNIEMVMKTNSDGPKPLPITFLSQYIAEHCRDSSI